MGRQFICCAKCIEKLSILGKTLPIEEGSYSFVTRPSVDLHATTESIGKVSFHHIQHLSHLLNKASSVESNQFIYQVNNNMEEDIQSNTFLPPSNKIQDPSLLTLSAPL